MHGPLSRAERYQKVAAEYLDFATTASSPFLRSYYQRTGEKYRLRAEAFWKRERVSVAAWPQPQPRLSIR
jgi:hypothetical protein